MKPDNVPYHLVTEHELGCLSNEVLAEYPGASDEFLEVALRERILDFVELRRLQAIEADKWDLDEDCDSPYQDA